MNSRKVLGGNCVFNWSVVCNHKRSQSFLKFGSVRVALPKSKTQVHATVLQLEHYYSRPCRQEAHRQPHLHTNHENIQQTGHNIPLWHEHLCSVCPTGSGAHSAGVRHFERLSGKAASPQLCSLAPRKQLSSTEFGGLHRYERIKWYQWPTLFNTPIWRCVK